MGRVLVLALMILSVGCVAEELDERKVEADSDWDLKLLVRTEDGRYTDGWYEFMFGEDGSVHCRLWADGEGGVVERVIETKAIRDWRVRTMVYDGFEDWWAEVPHQVVHEDEGGIYLYYHPPSGAGSGESYYDPANTRFFYVRHDCDVIDMSDIQGAHIVWYGGYFYFNTLTPYLYGTPGVGRIMRVDMDGVGNRTEIVGTPVFGTFQIHDGRVYYTCLSDGRAYSVGLNGGDRRLVGSRLVPDYHRVGLEFYGGFIISRFWLNSGYIFGAWAFPTEYAMPAVTHKLGHTFALFPEALRGEDGYEVVNWCDDLRFIFIRSKMDGSYWFLNDGRYRLFEDWELYFQWIREEIE
jgi:hypothetical protein